ncbi:SOUL family heme-binding protein [Allopusillimonas ginsengisoli]|uniref:SOUL family heme-binding protein n=1 Tax=Allopusillimonas ginsengisoli TaxID=453575 RepID=UPI0039C460C5
MATEEPKFKQLALQGKFEVREYHAVVVAETVVQGAMDTASRDGFKLIANYIFGENHKGVGLEQGASEKIAMTAPVIAEPDTGSHAISTTTPLTTEAVGIAQTMTFATCWRIQFFMPGQYTLASLPKPNNVAVVLREIPSSRYAVIRFSGLASASSIQTKTEELWHWMSVNRLIPASAPKLARYDPPWTLPVLRRNEIQIELRFS